MNAFYLSKRVKKSGQGIGGKFNGVYIKELLENQNLSDLKQSLPEEGHVFVSYLKSIRELHRLCTAKDLGNYEEVIDNFRKQFYQLYYSFNLSMTLKYM